MLPRLFRGRMDVYRSFGISPRTIRNNQPSSKKSQDLRSRFRALVPELPLEQFATTPTAP